MSHTTEISAIEIKDISALTAAIKELNSQGIKCSLIKDATPRAYFSNQAGMGQADYVIKLENAQYDIGLYKSDNGYTARTDLFMGEVAGQVGVKNAKTPQEALGKLYQTYAIHAATSQAIKQGYTVQRTTGQNGAVKLVVTGNF